MSLHNEIKVYENVVVSCSTGEVESYEPTFFNEVIRRREVNFIMQAIQAKKPKLILDYGCGGGWLSRLICDRGFQVVGIDLSEKLIKIANSICCKGDFIVCDAMKLPFKDDVFDFVVGISILHHLPDLRSAVRELKRISLPDAVFLFMEPNSLNPLSAFGRRFFPMEAHTKGEKPFTFGYLKTLLILAGFEIERYFATFFFSFPIARFLKITGMKLPSWLIKIISSFETLAEKMPLLNALNSNIVALAKLR
ncbi:MAG: class I SAM-dependent methyltransferase [Candidatus Verstraetearchaeota archaeon]|jgi:SAM-dependent methyltransferase|nr:class I SAM-dependent methyltransferase [Candidatus Verstraetearchaeota archaeon]